MESYTFAQAEQLTGTTRKALRNRVYRGQLESVLRGGVPRIPRSELERVGLLGGDDETGEVPGMAGEPSRETPMMDELLTRLERQAGELGELRVLTREADSLRSERERLLGELRETRAQVTELEARLAEVELDEDASAEVLVVAVVQEVDRFRGSADVLEYAGECREVLGDGYQRTRDGLTLIPRRLIDELLQALLIPRTASERCLRGQQQRVLPTTSSSRRPGRRAMTKCVTTRSAS